MHGLSVRLSPEIAYRKDSAQFILQLWNTANPPLSKCAANVGLQLMRNAFSSDKHGIYNCGIIDLKKNKIYFPKLANSEANALLSAELLSINHLWKHLLKQANTPKGSVIAPSPLLGDQP